MKTEFKNVLELLDYYKSKDECIKLLEYQRWKGKPYCPHCGYERVYKTSTGYKCASNECYKKFSPTVGTIFENSKIHLRVWFAAIYLITAHKKGISSYQLSRDLGITQKSAWFLEYRIREAMKESNLNFLGFETEIEVDETFIGGKNKNRQKSKRKKNIQGRSVEDKIPVIGLLQRNGKIITRVIKDTTKESLVPVIKAVVKKNSTIYTDEWQGYNSLSEDYKHESVNHGGEIYVVGNIHTQGVEGFWSILKRGIYGVYHHVSKKHLHRYCDEFCYRYNSREIKDSERFFLILTRINKRLKYNELINSV